MKQLHDIVQEIARTPMLLVASDYDGTLAPIVGDPAQAAPCRESIVALRQLSDLPRTVVAIISGRALRDLSSLTGAPDEVHLVGSHGSEFDPGFGAQLTPESVALRRRLEQELAEIASRAEGLSVEHKPASVAFHFRNADTETADRALEAVLDGPARYEGVYTKHGKKVVELGVVATDKGSALETIRQRVGATAALFIGDDLTDEDAFKTLRGPDVGVKVGEGESAALYRVGSEVAVSHLLATLAEARAAWLAGAHATPIERLSMLTDQRTVAIVTPDAGVCWMCAPRIDSPPVFADLLGGAGAGYFSVRPSGGEAPTGQRYEGDSFVLRTEWPRMRVTDYLDASNGRATQRAGRVDLVRVIEGRGKAVVSFAPRLDFGRTHTRLEQREDGLLVEGSVEPLVLRAPGVVWRIEEEGPHHTAIAEIDLGAGPVTLELRCGTGSLRPTLLPERERRRQSTAFHADWCRTLELPDLHADAVRRSALVLRGLVHGPTGAIAAAATTSLPESIGGVRNWDYRYCWPRDASMAATSLARLGSLREGLGMLDWLLGVVDHCSSAERLAPIYTVTGGTLGPEGEVGDLPGYAGSRPVRIGNSAALQVQLDVFGPIVTLVSELARRGAPLSSEHWRLVGAMADAVKNRWREPDHGIWEIRGPRRHHVHTKAMCWVTARCAAQISEDLLGRERPDLRTLAGEIQTELLEHGWNAELGTFVGSYDSSEVDASVLTLGLCGLLDPLDERFVSTVERVDEHLRVKQGVYRYRYEDGLPGVEGAFNLCTAWHIQSLAAVGRLDEARALLADYVELAGPTGLMSEEWDPQTGRALGNHPQAYSHLGLIDAVLAIQSATSARER
ncbi:MAG: trehalose-phosphatase [Phycisphaerales bacterium]|nr:trehalose-phosphatase [Phycisphaerales bacterium]